MTDLDLTEGQTATTLNSQTSILNRPRVGGGCATLAAIFFLAVLAFGAAYQSRPSYKIDLGDRLDRPYVTGFYDREPTEAFRDKAENKWDGVSWRWTRNQTQVDLPGIGSQPLIVTIRFNPVTNPNPSLMMWVNDNPLQLPPVQAGQGWTEQVIKVPANLFPDGHLHLKFKTNTFSPAGDNRELGLAVDWIKVEPASGSDFVRPPDSDFLPLIFTAVLAVLIFLSMGVPAILALGAGGLVVGGFSYWLINDRLTLTILMERDFIRTLFFLWVAAFVTTEYLPRVLRWFGVAAGRREGGWLAALFILQFVLLYFFQLHPQFIASDLGLSIHDVQRVQSGQLIFTHDLPNQKPAPYPPAFYYLLLPFTGLSGIADDKAVGNLIVLVNSILAASGVFLVYYIAGLFRQSTARLFSARVKRVEREFEAGTNWGGIIAAAFYAISRYQYLIFSQGNHTNLFASWAFLLFLAITTGTLCYRRRKHFSERIPPAAAPTRQKTGVSQSLAVSNHSDLPGLDFLKELEQDQAEQRRLKVKKDWFSRALVVWQKKIWPRLETAIRYLLPMAALLLVFLSHYGAFLFANVFMLAYIGLLAVLGDRLARREAFYLAICWFCALALAITFYYYNFLGLLGQQFSRTPGENPGPAFDIFKTIRTIYENNRDWFGLISLIAAAGGLLLWLVNRATAGQKRWWQLDPVIAALLALGATGLVFALAQALEGLETRYQLYIITVITILAGGLLGRIWRSGMAGVVLVVALFLFQFLSTLLFWLDRVTYYFL